MKKIFLLITSVLLFFSLTDTQAQRKIDINGAGKPDTVGNSVNKTFYTNFNPTNLDSIVLTLYCKGEIDLDSLDVKFGYSMPGQFTYTNGTNKIYSQTLTVNLDSNTVAYDSVGVTIPVSALKGWNFVQWQLRPAASGNDTGDLGQSVKAIETKYP